ncbi:MAG: hypothetical protein ACRD1X_01110 [Vicinamibacteria bacterium]
MALKRDDSFLQYLTMGAAGSARAADDLNGHGHQIIELERYTTSNKIWSTKIKRLRLPDLLCLRCGLRVEARAKSKLEVKLSDSPTVAGRQWDAGLNDDDLVALIHVVWDGRVATPSTWVEYFRVADLRATVASSKLGPPKSASEGAERDRTWPASVASQPGTVTAVSATHVTISWQNGPTRRLPIRQGFHVCVAPGDALASGRIIAGIAPHPTSVACPGDVWDPLVQSTDANPGARYAAVKALAFRGDAVAAVARLRELWENQAEDVRIRLEALAGLARREPDTWVPVLAEFRNTVEADMAMEAVFILSEVAAPAAADALAAILADQTLAEELRAAAAWGLGVGGHHQPEALLNYLEDPSDEVAMHSLVATGSELVDAALDQVAGRIANGDRASAAAIQVLARHGERGARVLLARVGSFESAKANAWVLFGLGLAGRASVSAAAGGEVPAGLGEALTPLWIGLTENWLAGDRAAVLDFLKRQIVREVLAAPEH